MVRDRGRGLVAGLGLGVLRRSTAASASRSGSADGQGVLFLADVEPDTGVREFAVLATSLHLGVHSLAQLRRDRVGLKNALDKVRNQWGRGGSTARDQKSCFSASCKVRRS